MATASKTPPIVKLGAWLLSLICFAIGFWHCHLGLKEMKPFNSEYGSILVAALILLLILITYHYAVVGKKHAFKFYIIGGLLFFLFNLNYFYPSYNARQLVKEEAIELNDTLQSYANKNVLFDSSGDVSALTDLRLLKKKILDEVLYQSGFGTVARSYLSQFNEILNKGIIDPKLRNEIRPSFKVGNDSNQRATIAKFLEEQMNQAIDGFVLKKIAVQKSDNAQDLLTGIEELKVARDKYTPILKLIINNDSEIPLDSVKTNSEIKSLGALVNDLDNATDKINKATKKTIFRKIGEAKTRNLGRIAHTISSVLSRLTKIDTLMMLILCLVIDLVIPLFIYVMIRKNDNETEDDFFLDKLFGRNKNFNR